jgi:hypothetical protein
MERSRHLQWRQGIDRALSELKEPVRWEATADTRDELHRGSPQAEVSIGHETQLAHVDSHVVSQSSKATWHLLS